MKKIFILLFIALPFFAIAQNSASITFSSKYLAIWSIATGAGDLENFDATINFDGSNLIVISKNQIIHKYKIDEFKPFEIKDKTGGIKEKGYILMEYTSGKAAQYLISIRKTGE